MNPEEKGWLNRYLEFRSNAKPVENLKKTFPRALDLDFQEQSLYRIIQPTGLMYGHPIQLPYLHHSQMWEWTPTGKMKVILTESFINSALLKGITDLKPQELQEQVRISATKMNEYLQSVYPEISVSGRTRWGKKKDPLQLSEEMIDRRVKLRRNWSRNYWTTFFHSSLLFLDVVYFGEWFKDDKIMTSDRIREAEDDLRFKLLKLIAAAAHADEMIQKEERNLFEYFLESSNLSLDKKKEAVDILHRGLDVKEVGLESIDSWVIKKYFLDLAILTVWADQEVNSSEKQFLKELCQLLGFSKDDLEQSELSIEAFVLEHWGQVHYLQSRHNFHIVRDHLIKRLKYILVKNKDRVAQEIRESQELMTLLNKSRKQQLTKVEQAKVREQLIDIIKIMPTVIIIALPFTFITLPILLSLMPKSSFPSAFQD